LRLRLLLEWCAVTVMTSAIVASLLLGNAIQRLDNVLYDSLVGLWAPPPSDRILLVTIDDASVAQLGRWPWSREVHARFLQRLAKAHVSAVAYDVLFTETAGAGQDRALGDALHAAGNVSLPVLFEAPGTDGRAIDVTLPLPEVAGAARHLGQVALFPEREGIARAVPLSLTVGDRTWLHLMELTYRTAQGHPSPAYQRLASTEAGRRAGFVTIPFRPVSGDFRTISFAKVLAGEVPPQLLENRIVLVGITAMGLGDRFRVPSRSGALISGIELQANVLSSLLADRTVVVPPRGLLLALSLVPVLLLLVSFWWLRPSRALPASLAAMGSVLVVPVLLLAVWGIWLAPASALVGLLVAYPLWGWRRLQAIDQQLGDELDRFDGEDGPLARGLDPGAYLDPVGGQAARLRAAIAEMRDLRRLVGDTIDSVNDPIFVTDADERPILANVAANALGPMPVPTSSEDGADVRLPDGSAYSLRRFPLRDHTGATRGSITHLVDITDIRAAQRVREEALEFLSHDMRAPQSAIIALVASHRDAIADPALGDRISGLARKTLRLADDFVQLARFAATPFAPEDVAVADVLTEAADDLWPTASRRGVKIAIDADESEPGFIAGERGALLRTFVNLLDNAVKFSPEGAVVHCSVHTADEGYVLCRIADEGPGIPPERRADLFASFGFSNDQAGTSLSSGLGLAFVAAVVARHHGTIAFEDRQPTGTCFVLRFPASA
jgi:CHASE2 domain-containing sensor protein